MTDIQNQSVADEPVIDDRKVSMFFELIRAVYGASKCDAQWPSDEYLMAAKQMWGELISRHTPDELREALKHAQKMSSNGEEEWQWPNVGLILSGAKRCANASHRLFLREPVETEEQKAARKAVAKERIASLKQLIQ